MRRNIIERQRLANEAMENGNFTDEIIHPARINKAKELIKKAHYFRLRHEQLPLAPAEPVIKLEPSSSVEVTTQARPVLLPPQSYDKYVADKPIARVRRSDRADLQQVKYSEEEALKRVLKRSKRDRGNVGPSTSSSGPSNALRRRKGA